MMEQERKREMREQEEVDEFAALEADIMANASSPYRSRSPPRNQPQPRSPPRNQRSPPRNRSQRNEPALFDDDEEWGDQPMFAPPVSADPYGAYPAQEAPRSRQRQRDPQPQSPPQSSLVQSRFGGPPANNQRRRRQQVQQPQQPQVGGGPQEAESEEIREKLELLELEIANFKEENRKIRAVRSEKELALQRLRIDTNEFEAEKEAFEEYKEAEQAELERRRKRVERMAREIQTLPDRNEKRDREVEELKQALAELRSASRDRELKLKAHVDRAKAKAAAAEERVADLASQIKALSEERLDAWDQLDAAVAESGNVARELDVLKSKHARTERKLASQTQDLERKDALVAQLQARVAELERSAATAVTAAPTTSATHTPPSSSSSSSGALAAPSSKSRRGPSVRFQDSVERFYYTPPSAMGGPEQASPSPSPSSLDGPNNSNNYYFAETEEAIDQALHESLYDERMESAPLSGGGSGDGGEEDEEAGELLERIQHENGKVEEVYANEKRVLFPNGTRKVVRGGYSIVTFANGDIRESFPDPEKRVVYYYADAKTLHTTYEDGLEVFEFGTTGQVEKHFKNGVKEITFADQTVKVVLPSGEEKTTFVDGTVQHVNPSGVRTIAFPNGDTEIHETDGTKRRECADGTIRIVFPDGAQETRWPSGRVRVKNPQGVVIRDSRDH